MKKLLTLCALLLTASVLQAQIKKPLKKNKWHWNQPGGQDTTAGYTQAVKVGNTLYISGTVGLDMNEEEVNRVYSNLAKTLAKFGLGFQHVVKENLYTTDIEAMKKLNHIRKRWYNGDFPAATWVQVVRLYMPEARLEVELTAQF
jgi:2-iminobutanoate/2-iminopropanoate deaminase